MRLSRLEKTTIIELAKKYFGQKARVYLFGSRVNDAKKGGDIDIYIETNEPADLQTKIKFLVEFEKRAGERKLDLIVKTSGSENQPIFDTARREGILLC
jgi:predicted nucleotidyltransferase